MMTLEEQLENTTLKLQLIETKGALLETQAQVLQAQHKDMMAEYQRLKHDSDRIASEERSKVATAVAEALAPQMGESKSEPATVVSEKG